MSTTVLPLRDARSFAFVFTYVNEKMPNFKFFSV